MNEGEITARGSLRKFPDIARKLVAMATSHLGLMHPEIIDLRFKKKNSSRIYSHSAKLPQCKHDN